MTNRAKGMNGLSRQMNSNGMIPEPPQRVAMIADAQALAAFAKRMHEADWIVVDTEFLRERTYYAELCLVQIANRDEVGLIDVLAIDDLAPLAELMGAPDLIKVFHAADQDIEVLYQALGTVPAPLFDTQVAAALTGLGDQIGYARMIEDLIDIRLPKTHTRTDWSRRPLSEQELAYAADDVRYLAAAYPVLHQRLIDLDRLAWAEADSTALASPDRLTPATETAWQRIRAWHRFEPAQQQVLASLAQWREQEAMDANRPRKWILSDDAIIALAQQQPNSTDALTHIKALPPKTAKRHGAELLAAIDAGRQHPATPLAAHSEPLSDEQKKDYKKARRALAVCAQESCIPAPMLARRKELEQMVAGERDLQALRGWRADIAGRAIVDVIEGRKRVVGDGGHAHLTPTS